MLPSILEVEEGSYTCLAGNEGGNASLSHQVDVKGEFTLLYIVALMM